MENMIRISVFNTLESDNVSVTGWYSYKDKPDQRYGLFTRTTGGLEDKRLVYNMKFMAPDVCISYVNLWQIYIKISHCDSGLTYEHIYRNWNEDICIGWLRPGQLGGETVNWFFNGENDCWYHGGPRGYSLVVSHRVTCGNIPTSVMQNGTDESNDNDQGSGQGNTTSNNGGQYVRPDSGQGSTTSNKGGQYVRPDSGQSNTTSNKGGQYVRPDSGQSSTTSNKGGQYVRPGSGQSSTTPNRRYPTGKGSILEKYMNEDGSPKEPNRLYPKPLGWGDSSTSEDCSTPNRRYPTGKGSILEKYMNEDGSPKEPNRLYPKPYYEVNQRSQSNDSSEQNSSTSNRGRQYIRPNSETDSSK